MDASQLLEELKAAQKALAEVGLEMEKGVPALTPGARKALHAYLRKYAIASATLAFLVGGFVGSLIQAYFFGKSVDQVTKAAVEVGSIRGEAQTLQREFLRTLEELKAEAATASHDLKGATDEYRAKLTQFEKDLASTDVAASLAGNETFRNAIGDRLSTIRAFGMVRANGDAVSAKGWKSKRLSTGVYEITFDSPTPSLPTILLTAEGKQDNTLSASEVTKGGFRIRSFDVSPNKNIPPQDADVWFLALCLE